MKSSITFFALLSLIFLNVGCNKEAKTAITYETNGLYGINVLALTSDSVEVSPVNYSMNATLGKDASLKVVVTKLTTSSANNVWFFADEDGWTVSDYVGTSQEFVANKSGNIDLNLIFQGHGTCRFDYYENSTSVTKAKVFSW